MDRPPRYQRPQAYGRGAQAPVPSRLNGTLVGRFGTASDHLYILFQSNLSLGRIGAINQIDDGAPNHRSVGNFPDCPEMLRSRYTKSTASGKSVCALTRSMNSGKWDGSCPRAPVTPVRLTQ